MKLFVEQDQQKSNAIALMAKITLNRLQETNTEKYPANTLIDYYCIIHKLIEAKTYRAGIKFSGEGAHKQLIHFAYKSKYICEQEHQFLQEMRNLRNRIAYEGFNLNKIYFKNNQKRIDLIIKKLQA